MDAPRHITTPDRDSASATVSAVGAAGAPAPAAPPALRSERERTRRLTRACLMVWTAVGAIVLTGVLVYLLDILSVPVSIVIWTTVIVFCLRTTVNRLESLGVPRPAGTALAYVLMAVVIAIVVTLMFSPAFGVGDQFANLVQSVPTYANDVITWGNALYAQYADVLQNDTVQQTLTAAFDALGNWASDFARQSATGVISIGTGVANTVMAIGFALVIAFWILMELPALGREAKRLGGPKRAETMEMLHVTFTRVMGGYIKGTLLQCAIIGVACGVLFLVVGIPNYAALGGITGLLNIIPIVGPWLGGALAAIVSVFVSPWAAIAALIGTIVIQQIVYTFVSPKIMEGSVDIHPALTLIALMAGSAIGGAMNGLSGSLVGMLASIPAVAVAKSVFVYYFEKRSGRTLVSEDGVFFKGTPTPDDGPNPIADATSPHPGSSGPVKRVARAVGKAAGRAHLTRDERPGGATAPADRGSDKER